MAKIHWSCGAESGSFELEGAISFGRGTENGLVLLDPKLSKVHARIEPDGSGGWKVVDQGSSNGLLSGGTRLSEIVLRPGSEFQAGDTKFRFEGAAVSGVEKTVLQATVLAATPAPVPASTPDPVPAPALPSTARSESEERDSRRFLLPAIVAAVAVLILGAWWLFSSGSDDRTGGTASGRKEAGVFSSEEEKRVVALENNLTSSDHGTRWGAYEKLKAMGRKPDPKPLWILDLKYDEDDDDRERAAEKLGEARYTPAIPQLRWSEKNDTDSNVRGAAEDALEAMGIKVD